MPWLWVGSHFHWHRWSTTWSMPHHPGFRRHLRRREEPDPANRSLQVQLGQQVQPDPGDQPPPGDQGGHPARWDPRRRGGPELGRRLLQLAGSSNTPICFKEPNRSRSRSGGSVLHPFAKGMPPEGHRFLASLLGFQALALRHMSGCQVNPDGLSANRSKDWVARVFLCAGREEGRRIVQETSKSLSFRYRFLSLIPRMRAAFPRCPSTDRSTRSTCALSNSAKEGNVSPS
jgi:hypothetical protein